MARTQPALAPFLDQLRERLENLNVQQLRTVLLTHAHTLEPASRTAFLAIFDLGEEVLPTADDDSLLGDIDGLVGRLRAGEFFDGWGWDDDLRDERSWGDESWAVEMDALFARAGQALLDGDVALADNAYRTLLDALSLDEEVGTFSGPSAAPDMLDTDLEEARARALRALYATTDADDRVDELAAAIGRWHCLGGHVGLRAVADALPTELPNIERFVGDWLDHWRPTGAQLDPHRRALLVEAATWQDGPDGVGALAQAHGADHPELFVDWVDALAQADTSKDAATACAHALSAMPATGEPRAQIAERAAALSDDPAQRLSGTRQAWRAAPTTLRLRRLAVLADDATLADEADALGQSAAPPRLAAGLLVLAGRINDATALLRSADPLGWSRSDHPGPLVLPILLLAAAAESASTPPPLPAANALLSAVDLLGWHDMTHLLGDDDDEPEHDDTPELSTLLAERLTALHAKPEQRSRWLSEARSLANARVTAIVEAKHRGAYDRAAQLAVACAEALAVTGSSAAAGTTITELRDRYPRHVAFRSALDAATATSPLLPPPPRHKRR